MNEISHTATLLVLVPSFLISFAPGLKMDKKSCFFSGYRILFYGWMMLYFTYFAARDIYASGGIVVALLIDLLAFLVILQCRLDRADNKDG